MKRMKTWMARTLLVLVMMAGFGLGLMAMGAALVMGLAIALAARLAGPHLLAQAERRAADLRARAGRSGDHDKEPCPSEHVPA